LEEVPRDREIAVYCQVGQRGYLATRILRQSGFHASNIGGGYKTYRLFYAGSK
jgi:rhodanese-related sulfurtransferase